VADALRVANCSGFYGDRLSAAREMVEGGPIDVLTGDYLAELTMLILWKSQQKDPGAGYATTFLRQMEEVLGTCLDRGIKVVANAGGLNPAGMAARLGDLAERLGLAPRVAWVEGDELLGRLGELQAGGHDLRHLDTGRPLAEAGVEPVSANAYLGAWGIVEALGAGADVVVCPRVTDASVVVGPAAWHHGWGRHDWDRLAGAVVAGHILECGAQATGGNYAFFATDLATDVATGGPGSLHPGFPLAEVHGDGSCVVTKHEGTGGVVSVGTVTAQLLYEIGGPRYLNPDVVARFDTVALDQEGPDRVRVHGVRGEPAPAELKVCLNYVGGWRNSVTFVLTGLDLEAKAAWAEAALFDLVGGRERFEAVDVRLLHAERSDAPGAELRVTVRDPDPRAVGRAFSGAAVELALASYPGFYLTAPPGPGDAYGVYWPALVPADAVDQVAVLPDGTRVAIAPADPPASSPPVDAVAPAVATVPGEPTRCLPLGTVVGARSGDKGGNANVGLWARSDEGYAWLASYLTVDRFRELLPESAGLAVERHELPNLRALNFVVVGLLGEGVAASTRPDPQAKSLGEVLRSRPVDVPVALLEGGSE
jgi:hypothetical protein